MSIPYIYRKDDSEVVILGESENLIALGEMLIFKGKHPRNASLTMKDGDGNEIKVLSSCDLDQELRKLGIATN